MNRLLINLLSIVVLAGCTAVSRHTDSAKEADNRSAACWQSVAKAVQRPAEVSAAMDRDKAALQDLAEVLMETRAVSVRLVQEYRRASAADAPVPPDLLDRIKRRLKTGPALADRTRDLMAPYQCWLQADATTLKAKGLAPMQPDLRTQGVVLSLAGALSLYDTYLTAAAVLQDDDNLRQFLNQADLGYGIGENQLDAVTESFRSLSALRDVRARIDFYRQSRDRIDAMARQDHVLAYLTAYIDQSPSHARLLDNLAPHIAGQIVENGRQALVDDLAMIRRESVNGLSRIFGNATGLVESRSGKLYGSDRVEKTVAAVLQPGDILLEKTPFRLTDRLIPGHWGHAAIWIGTEAQLVELGIWDDPLVARHHETIRSGHAVVEALRDGVQINSLAHFLNIDDLAVLRSNDRHAASRKEAVLQSLRQVGKAYDFNFDVETTDRIVCSELVYMAYPRVSWPTQKMAGRYTISPDAVAVRALNGGPLDVVMLYHDGVRVTDDPPSAVRRLMEAAGSPTD